MKPEELKLIVQGKYKKIVLGENTGCCGKTDCCGDTGYSMIGDDYIQMKGYNPDADLGLGCGIPVQYAGCQAAFFRVKNSILICLKKAA